MTRKPLIAVSVALAFCWMSWAKDEPKRQSDAELIQGQWRIVYFEEEGSVEPPESLKSITYVFADGKLTIRDGDKVLKTPCKFTLDSSKDPKTIDFKAEGEEDGPGIYQFDGDRLSICAPRGPGSAGRPTTFKAGEKSGLMLIRLERVKK
ncbi:MAG TPA: TIGR03067 domain-containing protein [Gemmataceae bacterium]|nr:TIGR03067 domain-containing protein [Gemmataceae bacterium]